MGVDSLGRKIPKRTKVWCDNISKSLKGRKFTEDWIKKMSMARIGKSPANKNKYITDNVSTTLSRERARRLYNNTKGKLLCFHCGSKKMITIHHVDFDPFNNKLKNLIPLCRSCHGKVHHPKGHKFGDERCKQCK